MKNMSPTEGAEFLLRYVDPTLVAQDDAPPPERAGVVRRAREASWRHATRLATDDDGRDRTQGGVEDSRTGMQDVVADIDVPDKSFEIAIRTLRAHDMCVERARRHVAWAGP